MGRNVRAVTLGEMASLLSDTGPAVTERQLRYLLIEGRLGADAEKRNHGRTRLYGSIDVALARAAVGLREAGVSAQLTRIILTYLRDDLVRAWKSAAPVGIAIRGVQASLEPAARGRPPKVSCWLPLRPMWQGLDARVQAIADARDDVWMYRRVRVSAVPRNTL